MVRKHKINKYKYEFRCSKPENAGVLYLSEGGKLICIVVFVDEEKEIPPPREDLKGVIYIAYKFDWYQNVIDMLRNEKPVYLIWDSTTRMARITTDEEPVGEEERQSALKFLFG